MSIIPKSGRQGNTKSERMITVRSSIRCRLGETEEELERSKAPEVSPPPDSEESIDPDLLHPKQLVLRYHMYLFQHLLGHLSGLPLAEDQPKRI